MDIKLVNAKPFISHPCPAFHHRHGLSTAGPFYWYSTADTATVPAGTLGAGAGSPGRSCSPRQGQVSGHSLLAQVEVMGAALRPEQNRNSTRRCLRSEGFTGEKLPCVGCVACCTNALGSGSFHTSEILKHLLDLFRHLPFYSPAP